MRSIMDKQDNTSVQKQTAVTAHFTSKQLLLFAFQWQKQNRNPTNEERHIVDYGDHW